MPTKNRRTDDAVNEFMDHLETLYGLAEATLYLKRRTLAALVRTAGGSTYTYALKEADFVRTVQFLSEGVSQDENDERKRQGLPGITGRSPETLKIDLATLRQFVQFCKRNGYLPQIADYLTPITRKAKEDTGDVVNQTTAVDFSVPLADFRRVLEHAGSHHPRTRMVAALGLLGGRRVSELTVIQISHINLLMNEINCANVKKGRPFTMAINAPMMDELKLYLKWYTETHGTLQPEWYLLPAKLRAQNVWQDKGLRARVLEDTRLWPTDPTRPCRRESLIEDAQTALEVMGWPDMRGLGVHVFRRSHAIALERVGKIALAQLSLDHKDLSTTQKFYGTRGDAAKQAYMDAFKGQDPFNLPDPTVPTPRVPADSNVVDFTARHRAKVTHKDEPTEIADSPGAGA